MFEAENTNDLTNQITFVIENESKAKKMAENLHNKVYIKSNCEIFFKKLSAIYHDPNYTD